MIIEGSLYAVLLYLLKISVVSISTTVSTLNIKEVIEVSGNVTERCLHKKDRGSVVTHDMFLLRVIQIG